MTKNSKKLKFRRSVRLNWFMKNAIDLEAERMAISSSVWVRIAILRNLKRERSGVIYKDKKIKIKIIKL